MSALLHDPNYVGDLGNGLIRRWSTSADESKIGQVMGGVYRHDATSPFNPRTADLARVLMSGKFPFMGPGDIAIVEDASKPKRPVVAYTCLWRLQWTYAGIPFPVGQPEMVGTDVEYRNRGLVRALFEMIHSRSAAEGHLVQGITGIPYFYRKFGYEYLLDLDGTRIIPVTAVPAKEDNEAEPYHLRLAQVADIPQLMAFYNQSRGASLVWNEAPTELWEQIICSWDEPFVQQAGATRVSLGTRLYMIEDTDGAIAGYVWLAARRRRANLEIYALQLAPGRNWAHALPCLLRLLREYGDQLPVIDENTKPFTGLNFILGGSHPVYDILGNSVASQTEPPYAWYIRVPDVPAFVRRIAPALEARLENSIHSGHTGEVKFDFYDGGLHMQFERGKIVSVAPWRKPHFGEDEIGGCPPLVFLKLLFGYRSLAELRTMFPDVWTTSEGESLVNTLFPALPSAVKSMGYV